MGTEPSSTPVPADTIDDDSNLLAALIERSRLYRTGEDYLRLMNFISRMRHMAPFNAALLHMQKPGMRFAATAADWRTRFDRTVKEGARPLLILWPFGPVALVYDVADTDGPALPADIAAPFRATGDITEKRLACMLAVLYGRGIRCQCIEYGQGHAGHIRARLVDTVKTSQGVQKRLYEIRLNAAHSASVQFATLAHELGHLFLGHLGADAVWNIKSRPRSSHAEQELEAELVAYLVCERQGVANVSEPYLAAFVHDPSSANLDIYAITQAAGRIEQTLGLAATIDIGVRKKKRLRPGDGCPPESEELLIEYGQ
jgi:hypothetical protein